MVVFPALLLENITENPCKNKPLLASVEGLLESVSFSSVFIFFG